MVIMDLSHLELQISDVVRNYYINTLGYDESEVDSLGLYRVDIRNNDIEEYTDIYLYAELSLDEFYVISDELNEVVMTVDSGAYFDAHSGGCFVCRIYWENANSNLTKEERQAKEDIQTNIEILLDFFTTHFDDISDDMQIDEYEYDDGRLYVEVSFEHFYELPFAINIPEFDLVNVQDYRGFVDRYAPKLFDAVKQAMKNY